jgi:hypothetical protein
MLEVELLDCARDGNEYMPTQINIESPITFLMFNDSLSPRLISRSAA